MEDSHESLMILASLNATFLSLIHKEYQASKPEKIRPISLWNVIYNLITTFIAIYLEPLPLLLISLEQNGYVEGR